MPHRQGFNLPGRKLVSQDDAAITQRADVPRSRFTGSWQRLTSFDAGLLYPILVDEVLPGDHLTYNITAYVRMSTPLFPIFSNQRVDTHFFFVPNRLVWENWERFMGSQDNPTDTIDYTIPQIVLTPAQLALGSIYDHMGLPVNQIATDPATLSINALPFRAYALIYNEWYRDQNIQDSFTVNKDNGPDDAGDVYIYFRAKFHDYFTSALPWPQKFIAPAIPLTGTADVKTALGGGGNIGVYSTTTSAVQRLDSSGALLNVSATPGGFAGSLYADLTDAIGIPINQFRQAFLVQQLLERDARGGTRYTELIRAHYGVINPDFRLQRPEYIGGGSSSLNVTPVAQTAPGSGTTVGALGAAGTSVGNHKASYAATEHGYIIGIMSVRTELAYQQGVHRMWSRQTRYDFYWPSLAGLGEQTILRKEIYARGTTDDDIVFGYQERWHEYRQRYSEVTGIMRSTVPGTLDAWHLVQRFTSAPTLSDAFIIDDPPMERVLAAGELASGQMYIADILFNRTAVRPLPTFGTPVTLGRF